MGCSLDFAHGLLVECSTADLAFLALCIIFMIVTVKDIVHFVRWTSLIGMHFISCIRALCPMISGSRVEIPCLKLRHRFLRPTAGSAHVANAHLARGLPEIPPT